MADDSRKKTLYDVLGVSREARAGDVRDAYSRLVSEFRKESTAPNPALEAMAKVAVDTLTDPGKRALYDKSLEAEARARPPPPERKKVRRKKGGQGPVVAVAALLVLAAGGAASWYFMSGPGAKPVGPAAASPQQVVDEVAPRIGRVQAALMSGEVRDLGIAVASAENEMVTPCRGFVAGAQLTVTVGSHVAQRADLARVHEERDICALSVGGAAAGLKLRGGDVPASEKLLAVVPPRGGGQPEWREVGAGKPIEDAKGPAIEVKSAEPLENGTPVFDSQARLVGLVVAPHAYGEGVVAMLGAARITPSRP